MSKFRQLIQKIETLKGAPLVGIEGVSEEEIEELTQIVGCPLPESYVDFLRVCGESIGKLSMEEDYSFSYVKEYFLEEFEGYLLEEFEHNSYVLPIAVGFEHYICIVINKNDPHINSPVYIKSAYFDWASWVSTPELDPRGLQAYDFFNWMASKIVYYTLMKDQKFSVFSQKFNLRSSIYNFITFTKFVEYSKKENIDQVIYNLFLQLGFVNFLEGVTKTVFMQGVNTYLTYFRAPLNEDFIIHVFTNQKDLKDTLEMELSRLLNINIRIEIQDYKF